MRITVVPHNGLLLALAVLSAMMIAPAGCRDKDTSGRKPVTPKNITPALFWEIPAQQKAAIRTLKIYVPEQFGGYAQLHPDRGPWASQLDRSVHEGDTDFFAFQLGRSMFEFAHPTIMLEWLPFDMWSSDFKAILGVALHSERSPAMYVARSLPESILDGWFADITDCVQDWPAARDHPLTRAAGTFNGRIYCIPGNELQWPVIAYRKDYFAEAGIRNEFGEPGPPSNWTWSDFRKYAKLLTRDTDGDGRIDRWGFVAEQYRFDLFYLDCSSLVYRIFIPDRTGKYTWRFNSQDPRLIPALETIREVYRQDRSIRAGVDYTWQVKDAEFAAGRVAMAMLMSSHPADYYVHRPFYFAGNIRTRDVLGMAPIPTDENGVRYVLPRSNLFGFNPLYSREQLKASMDWFRSWACGYANAVYLSTLQEKNRIWDKADPFPQYYLVTPYRTETPLPPSPGRDFFPKDFVNVYDVYGKAELFPLPRQFGLREPVQLSDALNNMLSEVLLTHKPLDRIVSEAAGKIDARCMDFKVDGDREKLKRYYEALVDFARRTMPPAAAAELADFVETQCRCW